MICTICTMDAWKSMKSIVGKSFVFFLCLWLSVISLHTADAARFVSEPQDATLRIKSDGELKITLGCTVDRGSGDRTKEVTISWKRDGVKLNNSTPGIKMSTAQGNRSTLSVSITGPLGSDILENYYQCEAVSSEADGASVVLSRPARVRVLGPPMFLEHPEDLTSTLGQTARFACLIDKSDDEIKPPTWYKNDAQFSIDNSRMTILPSGSLEIQNVRETDAGPYKCEQVDGGTGFSRSGRLYIIPNSDKDSAPPIFTAVPKSRTVLAGTDLVLECSAVAHPKQPRIMWLKEGGAIDFTENEGRYSIIGEANLMIRSVTPDDKGTYLCRAENREDSIDVQATIDVVIPPQISDQTVNYYAYEKDDVELTCGVTGTPTPQLQWLKNGVSILHGDYFQHPPGSTRLRILGLVSSDTGFYQCFGTNAGGSAQQTMHLKVLRPGQEKPPTQLGSPVNFTSTSATSDTISLKWSPPPHLVESVPVLGYTIYYKKLPDSLRERTVNLTKSAKNPVPPTETTIDRLQPNTTYIFRVQAYGTTGPGVHSNEITVRTVGEDPIIIDELVAVPLSSSSVHVSWSTTSDSVQRWIVFYQELNGGIFGNDDGRGATLTVNIPQAEIANLKPFTIYRIKVHAVSRNGPSPEETLSIRTLSDIPADTPHNFTVEPNSASSLRLSWLPPPPEFQNGQITGYKIKYKPKGKKRAETVTTDANTLTLIIPDLEKSTEYQVRIAAMNVNGTGPFTEWTNALTFAKDLDEASVPERPEGMQARPGSSSITITWTPARSRDGNDILVRGYTIGWGKGIPGLTKHKCICQKRFKTKDKLNSHQATHSIERPDASNVRMLSSDHNDVHTKLVDSRRRSFKIDNLRPNSEYVISLRAYNRVGDGIPIYENVRTLEEDDDDFSDELMNFLPPPVGLRAITLSPSSIILYWTDNGGFALRKEHGKVLYVVKYAPVESDKFSYINTTETTYVVENLRPGTTYEFSVSVVVGHKRSQWSLVTSNTTANSRPHPADLTLVGFTDSQAGQSSVVLNWQPPSSTVSHQHDSSLSLEDTLQSYIIYYTTTLKEWVEESVPDDVLTHKITGLTPDTTYYFKMSGKWRRSGFGQLTDVKSVTTPKALTHYHTIANNPPPIQRPNQVVLYVLIGLSILFALASVALCIYYKRKARDLENSAMGGKKDKKMKKMDPEMMKMTGSGKLNPPDLWIHHDQMELKQMQQHQTLLSSSSNEFDLIDDHRTTHSLDKRALRSSRRVVTTDDDDLETGSSTLRRINQKNKHSGSCSSVTVPLSLSSNASSQHNLTHNHGGQYSATSDYGTAQSTNNLSTLTRRSGAAAAGNLKSFGVPPPVINFPPGVGVVTNKSTPHVTDTRAANPVKVQNAPSVHNYFVQSSDEPSSPQMQKCYSTEELNQEINNLEGLMKDLVDITAKEFQC